MTDLISTGSMLIGVDEVYRSELVGGYLCYIRRTSSFNDIWQSFVIPDEVFLLSRDYPEAIHNTVTLAVRHADLALKYADRRITYFGDPED